ncbi:MAG: SpoIID/LytB domain-containing protein [Christensenellales bacterium]|jgi:stage II sporulation protein D
MFKKIIVILLLGALIVAGAGCARDRGTPSPSISPQTTPDAAPENSPSPSMAQRELTEEPQLKVYVVASGQVEDMAMEEYLEGVLAGEMHNDWPLEALKAQAIIARTFAVKFLEDKGEGGSKYEGADISTDVEEAQAYDAEGVNESIIQAIEETRGMVITHENEPIYAWFHSHAGGKTALAVEGLEYEGGEQPYIKVVESDESQDAPEETREWTATFTGQEITGAAAALGIEITDPSSIKIGATGESGRVTTFECAGVSIPAASFRVKLGAEKMRSTLIDQVSAEGGNVTFSGKGFGHGVGMSQWGAYEMANSGKTAEEIIQHYYSDVKIENFWR